MADIIKFGQSGTKLIFTEHFLGRAQQRVKAQFLDIPEDRIYRAARRFPNKKCRALIDDLYWIVFKYEPGLRQCVFLTLVPRHYVLPSPSIWVAI